MLFEELHVLPLRDPLFYLLDVCGIYKGRADCRQPGGDFQNILPCASWVEWGHTKLPPSSLSESEGSGWPRLFSWDERPGWKMANSQQGSGPCLLQPADPTPCFPREHLQGGLRPKHQILKELKDQSFPVSLSFSFRRLLPPFGQKSTPCPQQCPGTLGRPPLPQLPASFV